MAEAGWQPKGQLFQFVWASYGWLVPKVWIERNAVAQVFGWSVNGWQIDSGERCVLLPLFVWPPAAAFRVRHQLFAPSLSPSLFPLLPPPYSPPPTPPYLPLSLTGSGQRVRGQNTDKVKCFCVRKGAVPNTRKRTFAVLTLLFCAAKPTERALLNRAVCITCQ